ncbi:MAG TPA: FAD-dependent oxidoreductase [Acidimicrobiales bacterium]|nr:FAD-dependent oxidoreductase [Acidimicrobiales bacterium]
MAEPPVIEIREPGQPVRRLSLDRAIEVGRECDGALLSDPGVSRRHLKLVPSPTSLSVVDLGSHNGTLLNGYAVEGRATLQPGDILRLGQTEIIIVGRPAAPSPVQPAASRGTVMLGAVHEPAIPAPPVPVAAPQGPSAGRHLLDRMLGLVTRPDQPVFPNYMELPRRIPIGVWHVVRIVSVATYITLCVALFIRPAGALFAFFKVIVPLLPILFFVAPGLWRNICPLAASNQAPRVLGFTRGFTTPEWLRKRAYIIALVLFFGITSARLALFNLSAQATGILLSLTIANAFFMGFLFKGKSGWCSSICPLLPLQRVYGQTPFVTVPNSHCQPCVACTKNCYDFKPRVAYQADLHDPDPAWVNPRKLFAAALPGFILGFFTVLDRAGLTKVHAYEHLALYFGGSVAIFFVLDALLPVGASTMTALFGSAAINIFYWYVGVALADTVHVVTGAAVPWLRWPVRALVLVLSLIWLARTRAAERLFDQESAPAGQPIQLSARGAKVLKEVKEKEAANTVTVCFEADDKGVAAEAGLSLLEVAERNGQAIESGCRMGVCGADPVAVTEGMSCLSAPEEEERNTLRRLGFAESTRMACCARLQSGPVRVSLTPEAGDASVAKPTVYDRSIVSVVVIGNGIAGVTAADFIRRGHPDCEIHLVGAESHVLYNRMGISRLVYGRSAMQGLFLLAEQWYDEHGITAWLNTVATRIDLGTKQVHLGTRDALPYDRLILAMGSASSVPPIDGFGQPGSFVMRQAGDAIAIRSYAQQHGCREAVVAGGGLLGLEAAHSLHELGLHVTVLERGNRLLARQIDERCSELVHNYFDAIGMTVLYGAETVALAGDPAVGAALLKDGREVPCQLFLGAIGIKPHTELAAEAGIAVNRGVLVNDRMETSAEGVFAAGDIAEHNGMLLGLWPIAAKQGEVAAVNALGGDERLTAEVPACILKGAGIELSSIGRIEPDPGDELIVVENPAEQSYRRLVISGGRVVGGLVLGHHPEDFSAILAATKKEADIDASTVASLRNGDWSVLKGVAANQPVPV